jgi:hypothetical protein
VVVLAGAQLDDHLDLTCASWSVDEDLIAQLRAQDEFFWLDLVAPSAEDVQRIGALLGWHPLSIEDTQRMGQRPKLDVYGDAALLCCRPRWRCIPRTRTTTRWRRCTATSARVHRHRAR